jgi:hypothetical protein
MQIVDVDVNLNVNPTVDVVVDTTREPSVNRVLVSTRFKGEPSAQTTRSSTSTSMVAFRFTFRSRST